MTSTASIEDIAKALGIEEVDAEADKLSPSYNVAPTQDVLVVAEHDGVRTLETMRWGLVPFFSKDIKSGAKMINARADSVVTKPAYRKAFKKHRCLFPIDGYYEWEKTPKGKQPWYFQSKDSQPVVLAGLWEVWHDPEQPEDVPPLFSCTIVTTDANAEMEDIHDRMPLMLEPEEWETWLHGEPDDAKKLLRPPRTGLLDRYKISTAVNSTRNNGPELLEPLPGGKQRSRNITAPG